nr:hypothetical protein [Tanacetum cinerariifolium]
KLVTRVKRLEGLLQQRKRRLVLSNSEGEDVTTTEQEFDLAALHTLASATLVDVAVHATAAPSSSIPTVVDKGKEPMELDAAQLIYTEADWLDLLAKIATNSALSKQLLGDDVTEENMNERLSMLLLHDPLTAPEHGSSEPTVAAPPPSSSRHRRKHIAKKRVTPIVDVADAAMIKFDSDSNSDDDPLPYSLYAG